MTMRKIFALIIYLTVGAAVAATGAGDASQSVENKAAACKGCHGIPGYKTAYPEVYQVPKLGGQSAQYIESALKAYRKGERSHPSMRGVALSLSDQDIADLAAYYARQE